MIHYCASPNKSRAAAAFAVLLGLSAATIALVSRTAHSHAIIVAAEPAMNSTVPQGKLEIRLAFNSLIDPKRSSLRLQWPHGTEADVSLTPERPRGVLAGRARIDACPR